MRARCAAARERLRTTGIALPFAALFVVLSVTSSSFPTKVNLRNILDRQAATLTIAAAGTLVSWRAASTSPWLAGVRVDAIRALTFAVSGGAAGLAGVIDTSRVLSAQASSGDALAFTVLAGIVVGGTASSAARAPCGARSSACSSSR